MREESAAAVEKLKSELEAQHQASVNQLKALWSKQKEDEIQQQVNSQLSSAKAAWKEKLQTVCFPIVTVPLPRHPNKSFTSGLNVFPASVKVEMSWEQRLQEARMERQRETAELTCQTDETEGSSVTITGEELASRLGAQKQQLQAEADKAKRKAVDEARKQAQRELHEKHLEDMAKQVTELSL